MAGPSARFDGDGDAVIFDNDNDDFQLPDNFWAVFASCVAVFYMVEDSFDGCH